MSTESMPTESPSHRTYFYVGGQYVNNGEGQHVMTGQMYVEKLTPLHGVTHLWPLVFIHGAGQTGTVSPFPSSCSLLFLRMIAGSPNYDQEYTQRVILSILPLWPNSPFLGIGPINFSMPRTFLIRPMVARAGHRGFWIKAI